MTATVETYVGTLPNLTQIVVDKWQSGDVTAATRRHPHETWSAPVVLTAAPFESVGTA